MTFSTPDIRTLHTYHSVFAGDTGYIMSMFKDKCICICTCIDFFVICLPLYIYLFVRNTIHFYFLAWRPAVTTSPLRQEPVGGRNPFWRSQVPSTQTAIWRFQTQMSNWDMLSFTTFLWMYSCKSASSWNYFFLLKVFSLFNETPVNNSYLNIWSTAGIQQEELAVAQLSVHSLRSAPCSCGEKILANRWPNFNCIWKGNNNNNNNNNNKKKKKNNNNNNNNNNKNNKNNMSS